MNDDEAPDDPRGAEAERLLAHLKLEHHDMDCAIVALAAKPQSDLIQIARFKKKKLLLRDRIAQLEDRLTPDIIA